MYSKEHYIGKRTIRHRFARRSKINRQIVGMFLESAAATSPSIVEEKEEIRKQIRDSIAGSAGKTVR